MPPFCCILLIDGNTGQITFVAYIFQQIPCIVYAAKIFKPDFKIICTLLVGLAKQFFNGAVAEKAHFVVAPYAYIFKLVGARLHMAGDVPFWMAQYNLGNAA